MEGGDIASYAGLAGVTAATVRSQLKSIFAKTGVRRQSALVRLGQHEF
jgi:DNA-binding CsgD family transcriptional regulator